MDAETIHWPSGVPDSRRVEPEAGGKARSDEGIDGRNLQGNAGGQCHLTMASTPDSLLSEDPLDLATPEELRSDSQPGTPGEYSRLPDRALRIRSISFGARGRPAGDASSLTQGSSHAARDSPKVHVVAPAGAPSRPGICIDTVQRPTLLKSNTYTGSVHTSTSEESQAESPPKRLEGSLNQTKQPVRRRAERRATASPMPVALHNETHRKQQSPSPSCGEDASRGVTGHITVAVQTEDDELEPEEIETGENIGVRDWQTQAPMLGASDSVEAGRHTHAKNIDETTPTSYLDKERNQLIIHFWNQCQWDMAEKYLIGHLDSLDARSEAPSVRRVQHMLAVCSSFAGKWHEAIHRFIQVLRKPIAIVSHLDDGDCAAAYWLGDLYAMQDRRIDALLAYAIAERAPRLSSHPSAQQVLRAERATLRQGLSESDIEQRLSPDPNEAAEDAGHDSPSILDPQVISFEVAKLCLHNALSPSEEALSLEPNRPRSNYLANPSTMNTLHHTQPNTKSTITLDAAAFDPTSPWPLPFDPLLCITNIHHGHTLASPSPPSNEAEYCYTSLDVPTLLHQVCDCLRANDVEISQVVNKAGMTCFCVRRTCTLTGGVASVEYFRILAGEIPAREGLGGVVVLGEGEGEEMVSARVVKGNDGGGRALRKVRRTVRTYLEERMDEVQGEGGE